MKLRTKTLYNPIIDPSVQTYTEQLLQRQEQATQQKLKKEQYNQQRLIELQIKREQRDEQKRIELKNRIYKSQANKNKQLDKIVKKCKDYEKYVSKKQRDYRDKMKSSLRTRWKQAESFNDSILKYHNSRSYKGGISEENKFRNKTYQSDGDDGHPNTLLQVHPRYNPKTSNPPNIHLDTNSFYLTSPNNIIYNSLDPNKMHSQYKKPNSKTVLNSLGNQEAKRLFSRQNDRVRYHTIETAYKWGNGEYSHGKRKMSEGAGDGRLLATMQRMRNNRRHQETSKIQGLGQKLTKIQLKRKKRIQRMRARKIKASPQRPIHEYDSNKINTIKKKQKKIMQGEEDKHSMKEKRTKDWSTYNRFKREELKQDNFDHGSSYLENLRVRNFKGFLQRSIIESAIEKRLFLERIKKIKT